MAHCWGGGVWFGDDNSWMKNNWLKLNPRKREVTLVEICCIIVAFFLSLSKTEVVADNFSSLEVEAAYIIDIQRLTYSWSVFR